MLGKLSPTITGATRARAKVSQARVQGAAGADHHIPRPEPPGHRREVPGAHPGGLPGPPRPHVVPLEPGVAAPVGDQDPLLDRVLKGGHGGAGAGVDAPDAATA